MSDDGCYVSQGGASNGSVHSAANPDRDSNALLISFILFAILALAPGDPLAQFALEPGIPESTRQLIRVQLGTGPTVAVRYVKWLTQFSQGNFGFSFATKAPVMD